VIERFRVKGRTMPTMTRRSLIVGGASVAALAIGLPLAAGAQGTITVDQFRALSSRLTGVTDLNATAAGRLLDGFIAMGRGPDLALLVAKSGLSTGALADAIVATWYSGSYDTVAGRATFGLTNALVWKALKFTKPPGLCGGPTGYWADAPRS
jgi:hypothetical protein